MAYAFEQEVPIDESIYARIQRKLGEAPPAGLIMHLVVKREGGLRYIDVWESREHFERAFDGYIHKAVHDTFEEIGYRPPTEHAPALRDLDVVYVWTALAPAT